MAIPKNIVPDDVVATIIHEEAASIGGLPIEAEIVAFCVAVAESGLDQFAINVVLKDDPTDKYHGSLDLGIVQWNNVAWSSIPSKEAFDVRTSIRRMLQHVAGAKTLNEGFATWNVVDTLKFVRHVERAYAAFARIGVV